MRRLRTNTLIAALILAVLLVLTGTFTRARETAKVEGARYALLVGVDEYFDEANFAKLDYAEADVKLIRDKLVDVLKFQPENITILTTRSGLKNAPLREQIEEKLKAIVEKAQRGDVVFFMFAGHGFAKNGEDWLCPADGKYDQPEETALSVKALMKTLDRTEASFKLMVVDACRENRSLRLGGESIKPYRTIEDPPKGLFLYQSCQSGEYAHQDPALQHGIFSYYLAESFEKGDTDADGSITFFDIIKYTDERVRTRAREVFHNESQQPSINTQGLSDFIVVEGLLRDGITQEEWQKAEELYQEAVAFRRQMRYSEAKEKIASARAINKVREVYKEEEEDIDKHLEREKEIERQIAEAEKAKKKAEEDRKKAEEARKQAEAEAKKARESAAKPSESTAGTGGGEQRTRAEESSVGTWEGSRAGESKTLTLKGVKYTFRWCPSGSFQMGSPKNEKDRENDEQQHRVTLNRGFWMLETEVTQEMWESVMGDNPSRFKGANLPVESVSWNDCQDFIGKLNQTSGIPSGYKLSLPSEAQWEYACRAGSTGSYGGTGDLDEMGWYDDNSGSKTHEVRGKKPNAWGLYDMHGNVSEWCQDGWDGDYYGESPEQDPPGPGIGSWRVYRGGGWPNAVGLCRSAYRNGHQPGDRVSDLGLRLALVRQ